MGEDATSDAPNALVGGVPGARLVAMPFKKLTVEIPRSSISTRSIPAAGDTTSSDTSWEASIGKQPRGTTD